MSTRRAAIKAAVAFSRAAKFKTPSVSSSALTSAAIALRAASSGLSAWLKVA
jgi:hypothetical protein